MTDFVGLTWDHPRGRVALEAASGDIGAGDTIRWEAQSLEGFESAPIDELADRYDLIVLDHPHLGDAVSSSSLHPLDRLFSAEQIAVWSAGAVGPSIASYTWGGHLWALPLDAATQVSVRRAAALAQAPATWAELVEASAQHAVALSLAGPHAFLTLCSVAVALGDDPGVGDRCFARGTALDALEIMTEVAARAPAGSAALNPIGLLDRMRDERDIDLVPLVYGYVNYSSDEIRFEAPPSEARSGSTIGGTGIALSRRADPSPALLAHLGWLMSDEAQRGFIPGHQGQPALRSAWRDPEVDAAARGFYSATLDTIEQAWVRPRFPGYIPFQSSASALVRAAVGGELSASRALDEIDSAFATVLKEQS